MTLQQYVDNINKRYKLGNATEHTFRGDLQTLIESLVPEVHATNEPKRQSCGAPDYILTKKDNLSREFGVPVGFIEAKDIGDKDLDGVKKAGNKEQFDRYKASLNNLFFTDYLDNPTFRGMRWHLQKTFDKIYTIDLHGNSKKKETAPDGSADQNVFDIMQGVSNNVFVKKKKTP